MTILPVSEGERDGVDELPCGDDGAVTRAVVLYSARDVPRHRLLPVRAQDTVQRVNITVVYNVSGSGKIR